MKDFILIGVDKLHKMTKEQALKYYIRFIKKNDLLNLLDHSDESYDLFEDLSPYDEKKVYPAEIVVSSMLKCYERYDDWIQIVQRANNVNVLTVLPNIRDNLNNIVNDMNVCGYYVATRKSFMKDNKLWTILVFEPYHDINIANDVYNCQSGVIIHVTPDENVDSILQNGIIPKSENKLYSFPERVHLMYGNQDKGKKTYVLNMIRQLKEVSGKSQYSVVCINVDMLPKEMRFYNDPNHPNGFFTYQNIPADAIFNVVSENKYSPYI